MEKEKICFGDLNIPLKILVVLGWIIGALFMIGVLVGLFEGTI